MEAKHRSTVMPICRLVRRTCQVVTIGAGRSGNARQTSVTGNWLPPKHGGVGTALLPRAPLRRQNTRQRSLRRPARPSLIGLAGHPAPALYEPLSPTKSPSSTKYSSPPPCVCAGSAPAGRKSDDHRRSGDFVTRRHLWHRGRLNRSKQQHRTTNNAPHNAPPSRNDNRSRQDPTCFNCSQRSSDSQHPDAGSHLSRGSRLQCLTHRFPAW